MHKKMRRFACDLFRHRSLPYARSINMQQSAPCELLGGSGYASRGLFYVPQTHTDDSKKTQVSACSKPYLIGLAAPKGRGKDTVADIMRLIFMKANPGRVVFTSFAAPLRDCVQSMLNMDTYSLERDKECIRAGFGVTPRRVMQALGDLIRNEMPKHVPELAHVLEKRITLLLQEMNGHHGYVVVTDVRYEREASLIRSLGGSIWHIDGPDRRLPAVLAPDTGTVDVVDNKHNDDDDVVVELHSSENLLNVLDDDTIIHNELGVSKDALEKQIRDLLGIHIKCYALC